MSKRTNDTNVPSEDAVPTEVIDAKAEAEKILAEARAQAAQIVAEAAAKPTTANSSADDADDLVTIKLFKDSDKYKDDVFVGVNGVAWQIQRGVEVEVPRYVADVLEQSMAQDTATANMITRKSEEFEAEAKARNL